MTKSLKILNKIGYALLSSIVFFIASYLAQYFVIRNLSVIDYGLFALINNVTSIISYTTTILANALLLDIKLIANNQERKEFLNKVLILILLLGITITLPLFTIYAYSMHLSVLENIILFVFVFLNITLSTWITIFTSYLIGHLKFKQQLITTLINSILKLLSFSILSLLFGLWGSIAAFIIAPVFTTFGLLIKYKKLVLEFLSHISLSTLLNKMDKAVLTRFLKVLFVIFITQADILIVNLVTKDPTQVGLYAQLSLVLKMPIMLGIPIIQTYLPLYANKKINLPIYFLPILLALFSASLLIALQLDPFYLLLPFEKSSNNSTILFLGLITNYLSICLLYQAQLKDLMKSKAPYFIFTVTITVLYFVGGYYKLFNGMEQAFSIWITVLLIHLTLGLIQTNETALKRIQLVLTACLIIICSAILYLIIDRYYQVKLHYFYPDSFMYYELSKGLPLDLFPYSLFRIQYELRILPVYILKVFELLVSPIQSNILLNILSTIGTIVLLIRVNLKYNKELIIKLLLLISSTVFLISPFLMNIDPFTIFIILLNLTTLNSKHFLLRSLSLFLLIITRIDIALIFIIITLIKRDWKSVAISVVLASPLLLLNLKAVPILFMSITHAKYFILAIIIPVITFFAYKLLKRVDVNFHKLFKITLLIITILGLIGIVETVGGYNILNYFNFFPPITYLPLLLAKLSLPIVLTFLLFDIDLKKEYFFIILYLYLIYFVITSTNIRYFFIIESVLLYALIKDFKWHVNSNSGYKFGIILVFVLFNIIFIGNTPFIKWDKELKKEIEYSQTVNNKIIYSKNSLGLNYLGNNSNKYYQLGNYKSSGYWECNDTTNTNDSIIIISEKENNSKCLDKFKSITNERLYIIKN